MNVAATAIKIQSTRKLTKYKENNWGFLACKLLTRKVGFHVSIAGGISNSVDNAKKIGCSAFQIFSRNPRGWAAKPLDPNDVELFRQKLAKSTIEPDSVVVHMPYLPNLSGPLGESYDMSVQTLSEEIRRCSVLGIPYLVIHLGSHMGKGSPMGISQLTSAIASARSSADKASRKNQVTILLENNAGRKNSVGSSFEELREILDMAHARKGELGICLDTCHLLASGYDIRTKGGVEKILGLFDKIVGLGELKVVHLNDSKGGLASHLDSHEHIGLGEIGSAGLSAFLNHPNMTKLPFIMETPIDEKRSEADNLSSVIQMLG